MGLFDKANNDYNKALDHYRIAKSTTPTSPTFLKELEIASTLLQKSINENKITPDCLVLLSNIYFLIYAFAMSIPQDPMINRIEYLSMSAALIQHWKKSIKGYNKNSKQGNQLYKMITCEILNSIALMNISQGIDTTMNLIHDKYYQHAINKYL